MKIITSSSTKNRTTAITIEADKGENLEEFKAMLGSHKWVRQNEYGELETAPAHLDPPLLYDQRIDPIWDGKPARMRQLREAKEKHKKVFTDRSFYVQHIAGYSGGFSEKAQRMFINGFVPLRSKRSNRDGKCWEIWYLPGAWAAEGELRGKTEEQIKSWLFQEIGPGNVEFSGESWGLSAD
jgi:hypothetical protein